MASKQRGRHMKTYRDVLIEATELMTEELEIIMKDQGEREATWPEHRLNDDEDVDD